MESTFEFLQISPVSTMSVSDHIANALREAIVNAVLPAGGLLRQDDISARFNVSKIPVREALKKLESEGLVKFSRNRGAVVTSLSIDEIVEYVDLRATLEARAAEIAAPHISDESIKIAENYLNLFDHVEQARISEINWKLHSALYKDANRPILIAKIKSTYNQVDRYVRMLMAMTPEISNTSIEHRAILDAFVRRSPHDAAELTRNHVTNGGAVLIKFLQEQRDKNNN